MLGSVLYMGVLIGILGFFMSASRLLNCFLVVEKIGFLLIMLCCIRESGVLFLSLIVVFTVESALALVVLFRVWDRSDLKDVVGC